MKKIVLTVAALSVLAVPLSSMAADDTFYLKASLGTGMALDTDVDNMPDNAGTAKVTYDTGWMGTFGAGYSFFGPLRADFEYVWQKNDVDRLSYNNEYANFMEGDLKLQAFMVNGYFDAPTGSAWTPFVGAGIGWAKLDLNTPGLPSSDYDDAFAYQLIAGVAYAINDILSLDAQYRFFGTGDASISGADYNMTSNDLMLGMAVSF